MNLPTVDYEITAPLAEETRAKLQRTFGDHRAAVIWTHVCAAAGCSEKGPHSPEELIAIGGKLQGVEGLVGVFGCSLAVRARSFQQLRSINRSHGTPLEMKTSPLPLSGLTAFDERARLEEIAALGLLSGTTDPVLQAAVEAASEELNLPVALVSIVLDDAQYFAAMGGVDGWMKESRGTPLEWSFCVNAVRERKPFIVEDAALHPVVKDNPLVRTDGIRCYAGVPLITSKGHALGSFCVAGNEVRQFTEVEISRLKDCAGRVVAELEKRRAPAPRA